MDAALCIGEKPRQPKCGDISICFECGDILVFTEELAMRAAEIKDLLKLSDKNNYELTTAQELIRQIPK